MRSSERSEVIRRARRFGIQAEFTDVSGNRRKANVETLRAMLELFGDAESEPLCLPPAIVCWDGRPKAIRINLPAEMPRRLSHANTSVLLCPTKIASWSARIEQPTRSVDAIGHDVITQHQAIIQRRSDSLAVLQIPSLPFGYYHLRLQLNGRENRTLIISAPQKAWTQRGPSEWGVFAPMYAVHSERSWGAGNLTDWQRLCESLADVKGQAAPSAERSGARATHSSNVVVATLPLLGAFLDDWKCEPSPYSPATRLFWNEFYLDVTRVPECTLNKQARQRAGSREFQNAIRKLRQSHLIDYQAEMALKRQVLEQLASEFFQGTAERFPDFQAFLNRRPELERYAEFRAICEKRKQSWHSWPERLRRGELRASDFTESARRYHLFAQWCAQEQIDALLSNCRERGVRFYLDLPLGVNPDGYDVWANQHLFVNGASVGAPPDAFFTKGQDWGFPPLHPHRIREDGYDYLIDYLRFQMRHAGLLRIDHVMGLHRLWWVPQGASAADGAYVSYNAEELYAILCLESHLHQTTLIGENLGTVPPEVNKCMKRRGLRTMYVAQYEAQPAATPLRAPPRDCVASLNTHDMPTWAAHWKGLDIIDRQKLGLLTAKQARDEKKRRARLRLALEKFLRRKQLLTGKANARSVLRAMLKFLARSDAELVLVNLEDLLLETEPQNTPGTTTERVNWRRKTRLLLRPLTECPDVRQLLQILAERAART